MSLPSFPEICASCARFIGAQRGPMLESDEAGNEREVVPPLVCEAFPAGIPESVMSGDNDHSQPIDGDGGLTYVEIVV